MAEIVCDICVVGAGSAGLSLAAGAAQMGARVVLIEKGRMGGDCLNFGCVPSKALLAAAKAAVPGPFGAARVPDYAEAQAHLRGVIAAIAPHDSQERFEGLGVTVLRDTARFTAPDRMQAGETVIRARRFVIATGSRAAIPDLPGLEGVPYLTNETLFDLPALPRHLLILGGGPIGMEMAQAHRRLGAEVTVIQRGRVLARDDEELAALVRDRLVAEGVTIREHAAVRSVAALPEGVALDLADGSRVTGSHLLIAAGRRPNIESLDLDRAGIAATPQGITVDKGLRTGNRRAYAIGDVAGQGQFTHLAGYHAGVAVRAILFGLPARARTDHIPRVTYTDPELAQIGLTEVEARDRHGDRLTVIRQPFDGSDRALAEGRATGLLKLMVVKGRPVGVSIAGPAAGDLIGLWALIVSQGLGLKALSDTVLPYPTLQELNKRAAGAYFSPKLFHNPKVKTVVRLIQRLIP